MRNLSPREKKTHELGWPANKKILEMRGLSEKKNLKVKGLAQKTPRIGRPAKNPRNMGPEQKTPQLRLFSTGESYFSLEKYRIIRFKTPNRRIQAKPNQSAETPNRTITELT